MIIQTGVWYRDPTVVGLLGALGGALIGAIATLWVWRKSNKFKRIDCIEDEPISLLSLSDAFQGRLNLQVNGRTVNSAFVFPYEIVNTGNQAISHQPILLQFSEGTEIVDIKMDTQPAIGFGPISVDGQGTRSARIVIELLNPGDSVRLEILTLGNTDEEVDVGLKNADVIARVLPRATLRSAFAEAATQSTMMAAISLFPLVGRVAGVYATMELSRRLENPNRRKAEKR